MVKNSFRMAAVILLIALAVFAYFTYLSPQAAQGPAVIDLDQPSEAPSSTATQAQQSPETKYLETYSFSTASKVPNTNLTFHYNFSVVNGLRADFFSFENPGKTTRLKLLVFVPKEVAEHVSDFAASFSFTVLQDDPVVASTMDIIGHAGGSFYGITGVQGGRYGIRVNPAGSPLPLVAIPLRGDYSTPQIEQLRQLIARHERYILSHPAERQEMQDRLAYIFAGQRGDLDEQFPAILAAANGFLEERDPTTRTSQRRQVQPPATLAGVSLTVGEFTPVDVTDVPLPQFPPGVRVEARVEYPDVSAAGDRWVQATGIADGQGSLTGAIKVDFSNVELKGAKFPFETARANVYFWSPATNRIVAVPVQVQVRHASNILQSMPLFISNRKGGEWVFLVNNLPRRITRVRGCGLQRAIDLPGAASPTSAQPTATFVYIPENQKPTTGRPCNFEQNGVEIQTGARVAVRTESNNADVEFSSFLPVLTYASSFQDCTQNYCSCDAARRAILDAAQKAITDVQSYYVENKGYEARGGKWWKHYVANFAGLEPGCFSAPIQAGGARVSFDSSAAAKSGAINLVALGVDLTDPRNRNLQREVTVSFYNSPENFVGLPTDNYDTGQIASALTQQWLCHHNSNLFELPESKPNDECSQQQRFPQGQVVAVR